MAKKAAGPETLNTRMEKAYKKMMQGNREQACLDHLDCWAEIRRRLPNVPFDVEAEEEKVFPELEESLLEWMITVEADLSDTAETLPNCERYLKFCTDMLECFALPADIHADFRRSRADALWMGERPDEALAAIADLLKEDPDDAWTWLWWGEFYIEARPANIERGLEIYRDALARPTLRDREIIEERVEDLKGGAESGVEPAADEEGAPATPKQVPITVDKVGRNEPCTCGSGKKYKKCCGA